MRLFTLFSLMALSLFAQAQKVSGKLTFQPGQVLYITTKTNTVNVVSAMGQEIEIKAETNVDQLFKVTNTTEENHTLSHEIKRIRFTSEGMGSNMSFDSDSEKDMKGQFGEPIKEMMNQKYNMVIDASGNTVMAMSEGGGSSKTTAASGALAQFTGGMMEMTRAPKSGEASFFKVLPATPVGVGDGWTNTIENNGTKTDEAYSVAEINDEFIILNYLANSATSSVQENMGMEVTINVKNKIEGKIKVDRKTGIVKEKTTKTTSTGTANTSYGEFPINTTSDTVMTIN